MNSFTKVDLIFENNNHFFTFDFNEAHFELPSLLTRRNMDLFNDEAEPKLELF